MFYGYVSKIVLDREKEGKISDMEIKLMKELSNKITEKSVESTEHEENDQEGLYIAELNSLTFDSQENLPKAPGMVKDNIACELKYSYIIGAAHILELSKDDFDAEIGKLFCEIVTCWTSDPVALNYDMEGNLPPYIYIYIYIYIHVKTLMVTQTLI